MNNIGKFPYDLKTAAAKDYHIAMLSYGPYNLIQHVNNIISTVLPSRIELLPKTGQDIVFSIELDQSILTEYV